MLKVAKPSQSLKYEGNECNVDSGCQTKTGERENGLGGKGKQGERIHREDGKEREG